jgi:hypothetical protein
VLSTDGEEDVMNEAMTHDDRCPEQGRSNPADEAPCACLAPSLAYLALVAWPSIDLDQLRASIHYAYRPFLNNASVPEQDVRTTQSTV